MLKEIMSYFGLKKEFTQAGYFEIESHTKLFEEVKAAIQTGKLIAFCGIVGYGKTTALWRIQKDLQQEKKILVSQSLAVDKDRIKLPTLIQALYYDLSSGKEVNIPSQAEKRERKLRRLIQKQNRPVALFIDEAHELHGSTLKSLKKLMELIKKDGNVLSVVLSGHPRLKIDLRRSIREEIGARTTVFVFEGIKGIAQYYIEWLLDQCRTAKIESSDIITDEAINLLSERLVTPLQIEHYLTLAFEEAYQLGQKPVTLDITESVLANDIDDLEPRLTRYGYNIKSLSEQFHLRPKEVRYFLNGRLSSERSREITNEMLAAGIPL